MRTIVGLLAIGQPLAALQQQPLHNNADTTSKPAWNLNFSSFAPHYFASAYGLLQQWPNTFFPNGHSIAPCEIAPLTNLYHGRRDGELPPSPEWIAFDIGMAYGIMGGSRNSHMLTYQTTRKTRCVYFDGESATLFGIGQMDTQNLHIYGNVSGPDKPPGGHFGLWDEYARASGLCDWLHESGLGGPGQYEGIVRMNAGFEMIWCNFSSPSLRLISHLNVTAPLLLHPNEMGEILENTEPSSYFPLPPSPTRTDRSTSPSDPPAPPNWDHRNDLSQEPFRSTQAWNWFTSGTLHYGSSGEGSGLGETRVKINSCGFLSYYSPNFTHQSVARAKEERKSLNLTKEGYWQSPEEENSRSLALQALTRRRRSHHLDAISPYNALRMRNSSERVLKSLIQIPYDDCSGIDWIVMTNGIVQIYAIPLDNFRRSLSKFNELPMSNKTAMQNWMVSVRDESHTFLLPFLEYPEEASKPRIWSSDSELFKRTYLLCKYDRTRLLDPVFGIPLTSEENLLREAIEETLGGICGVLVDVGMSIESLWQSRFNAGSPTLTMQEMESEVVRWTHSIEELMAWLGWAGEWTRCENKCARDEKCFIPMWPMIPMLRPPGYERPGYRGPGYRRPGYGYPPGYGPPVNHTDPGHGFKWHQDETNLWEPKCVKSDFLSSH